jgi:hypothetical protein
MFKKIKTLLTGSLEVKTTETGDIVHDASNTNEELVNSFMNQILESAWVEEDLKAMFAPCYMLCDKNKTYWLMNTTLKSLFSIKGGIEITPIESGEKNTICLIGQATYSIPNGLIKYAGWN